MSSKRKQIRNAVVAMLNGKTSAGASVYAQRPYSGWDMDLPAILVYWETESYEPLGVSEYSYKRTLPIRIEVRNELAEQIDDSLDDLAQEVEDIIKADGSITELANSALLTASELSESEQGNKMIGSVTLTYDVTYTDEF